MVRGRGRTAGAGRLGGRALAVAGMLGALALAAAGCGSESHPNEPRPQVASRVSVTINPDTVVVRPRRIGVGPARSQQIPQNRDHAQPPIETEAPLDVVFVAANQTQSDARLLVRGPRSARSETIFGMTPGKLQTALPTGTYTVRAAGLPDARPGKLVVGPYRASSQNDVLLP